MLASDVLPSRLMRAKLADFGLHPAPRSWPRGIGCFCRQAFLQCPLTFDYGAFQEALSIIDDKTIPIPGTDIARGLDEGLHAMQKSERQKLLVVVTDGEDLEKRGIKMAGDLAKQGVTIYTVGVGTPAGGEIQILNEQGKPELLPRHCG
jgi:Ca-activated chloride channel family protein